MKRQMRMAITASAVLGAGVAFAASDVTVPAPNGVGDVVALTNALMQANAGTVGNVLLEPGFYDLKDVAMESGAHLALTKTGKWLIGTGANPSEVILKGGGQEKKCSVLRLSGGNYGNFCNVSNVTITGGWTPDNGGGINGHTHARAFCCIISNNYATGSNGGGGGGMFKGIAQNCYFADNVVSKGIDGSHWGGGMWTDANVALGVGQGAYDCVFSNNWARQYGGGFYGAGEVKGCTFVDNYAQVSGGGVCNAALIADCTFIGNRAESTGGGLYADKACGPVSNCIFRLNKNGTLPGGNALAGANASVGLVAIGCELSDNTNDAAAVCSYVTFRESVITNHWSTRWVLQDCNLYGCLIADNHSSYGSGGAILDAGATCTNANCIFLRNTQAGNNLLTDAKTIVNCLYAENTVANANYGNIIDPGAMVYNTVFFDNMMGSSKCDFRKALKGSPYVPKMYNCTYSALANDVASDETAARWTDCVKKTLAELKYSTKDPVRPYVPRRPSPLRNKALETPWILATLGEKDIYGETRVFEDALDIGPAECIEPALGFLLFFR